MNVFQFLGSTDTLEARLCKAAQLKYELICRWHVRHWCAVVALAAQLKSVWLCEIRFTFRLRGLKFMRHGLPMNIQGVRIGMYQRRTCVAM